MRFVALLLSACAYGGGAYAGYGAKTGFIAGVEGGVGVDNWRTNVGFDRVGHIFARVDLTQDEPPQGFAGPTPGVFFEPRLGVGVVGSIINGEHVEHHLTGVFGLGALDAYKVTTPSGQDPVCSYDIRSASFELQVRFTDELEVVLAGYAAKSGNRCSY